MTRRKLIILSVIYVLIVAGLYWAAYSPAVHAAIRSSESNDT